MIYAKKYGMSIAAEEAGKWPGLPIQQNSQAVSRVSCMCSNVFFVEDVMFGEGEEYGLSFWASARASQRKWAFLVLSLFLERDTLHLCPF